MGPPGLDDGAESEEPPGRERDRRRGDEERGAGPSLQQEPEGDGGGDHHGGLTGKGAEGEQHGRRHVPAPVGEGDAREGEAVREWLDREDEDGRERRDGGQVPDRRGTAVAGGEVGHGRDEEPEPHDPEREQGVDERVAPSRGGGERGLEDPHEPVARHVEVTGGLVQVREGPGHGVRLLAVVPGARQLERLVEVTGHERGRGAGPAREQQVERVEDVAREQHQHGDRGGGRGGDADSEGGWPGGHGGGA